MNILQEVENFISEFNQDSSQEFSIDTIRSEFSKQHKLEALRSLGEWVRLGKNENILHKLKKKHKDEEITSVYRLKGYDVYYYNKKDTAYRKAILVIFGMHQYHKVSPPRQLIEKLLFIVKNISNVDICFDMTFKPNLELLKKYFTLKQYITEDGVLTDTWYINYPDTTMIEKIIIYNKAFKNSLEGVLWRIEAKILIPNVKILALPLYEFKQIINLGRGIDD